MSTAQFPDISQYTPVPLAGAPVALARATISNTKDTYWDRAVADAQAHGTPLLAYCFLNSGKLGVSPADQARFAFSVVGRRPAMLDHEPNRGYCATLGEACQWIDEYRSLGGVAYLDYMPHWSWQSMGSPDLRPLADRGMFLVSSNYTTYSDTGPGWTPYYPLCPVPIIQWQFADNHPFNGVACDWNAIKIPLAEYLSKAAGGTVTPEEHNWLYNIFRAIFYGGTSCGQVTGQPPLNADPVPNGGGMANSVFDQLAVLRAAMASPPAPLALSASDLADLEAKLTAAVVASHDALTDADAPVIEAAVRTVLHGA